VEHSRSQLAGYALAAVLAVAVAIKLLAPHHGSHGAAPVRIASGPEVPVARGDARGGLYVHVAGAVRRPGLYRVPPDSRVAAAIDRAGGAARKADLTAVNLAQRLEDGQQVIVPKAGAATAVGTAPASGQAGAAGAGGKLSLGTASAEQLDSLDGIGPTLAKRIVEYRQAHGGFRSLDQLRQVGGIGEKRFDTLRDGLRP
jgi:competence protein ComEA